MIQRFYNSVASISNTGPVEFLVPCDNECSFILNQTRLSGHFVVTNDDGGFVTNESKVALVNYFAACLFSQVEVYLNGVQIADLSSAVTYPWRMFIQSFLSYQYDVKDTYLAAKGFYNKTMSEITATEIPAEIESSSLKKRRNLILNGKELKACRLSTSPTLLMAACPNKCFFVMVDNQAMSHAPNKNLFNFEHFNLSSFNLKKNDQCVFPKPFQPNIQEGDAVDLYRHLYDSIGILHGNQSIRLLYDAFINGRFFLAADLTPDQCNSYHIHPENYGNLDLELAFSEITPHPIYVLALSIFNSGIKIDQFQQVIKGTN